MFVCTANTARSHLAAALWRRASPIAAAPPGPTPASGSTRCRRGRARHGLACPTSPRDCSTRSRDGDLVITVCDRAHEELGAPAGRTGPSPTPSRRHDQAFDHAYQAIAGRVEQLAGQLSGAPYRGRASSGDAGFRTGRAVSKLGAFGIWCWVSEGASMG